MTYIDSSVLLAHLLAEDHLRRQGQTVELATYDRRMADAAGAMGIPLCDLPT